MNEDGPRQESRQMQIGLGVLATPSPICECVFNIQNKMIDTGAARRQPWV